MPSTLRRRLYAARKPPLGSRVDWAHPGARGLTGLWLFAEGGGATARNLARPAGPATLQGTVGWGVSPPGRSLTFPGSAGNHVTTPTWAGLRTATITVAAYARATSGAGAVLVNVDYDGSSVPLSLAVGGASYAGVQAAFSSYTGATGWVSALAAADYRDSQWHLFVGTYDGAVIRIYVDGRLDGSTTQAGLLATTNTNTLDFGRYASDTTTYLVGAMGWVGLWNRALATPEVQSLASQPFAMVVPPAPHQRWDILAGAAPVDPFPVAYQRAIWPIVRSW